MSCYLVASYVTYCPIQLNSIHRQFYNCCSSFAFWDGIDIQYSHNSFKTCRRKISILNTKYYESPFEKYRVLKNDIMITKFSKNKFNKSNNEYYNLETIFEKFILWIWTGQKPCDEQQKSKHSFSVFRIIHFRMSSECFRRYLNSFVDSTQICPTQ